MRARLGARVAVLALAVGGATAAVPAAAQEPALRAKAALVIETSTGDVLLTRNSRDRRAMASTTKLMTALVAIERTDLDDVFSATAYNAAPAESQIGLRAGERLSVRDLLRALLLPSANDAAATLAVGTLGSQEAFVDEMNRRAADIGLRDTSFANPIGLDDPGNFSSARDLATLAIRLRRSQFFRRTVDLPRAVLRSGSRKRTVINRNTLLRRFNFANGVKTGRTSQAGYVLVGSATRRGVNVVSVVMGEPSERARNEDSLALLRYGLRSYAAKTLLAEGRILGKVALRFRDGEHVEVVAGASVDRVIRVGDATSVKVEGLPDEVDGPLPRGSKVGTAIVRQKGKVIKRVPVVIGRPVSEAGFGDRLGDFIGSSQTLVAIVALLVCSLPLLVLRNRVVRRRRELDAEDRAAQTPVS
ncbi:MAG: D-alanyl-D-alanine carboxypeptidase [Actinomycetota bacterium]|nr:D-alanyl-D-alanine carboxypeptidase [Actinomycetota bacterium]